MVDLLRIHRILIATGLLAVAGAVPAQGQGEGQEVFRRLKLRVIQKFPNKRVLIDRGKRDRVKDGDAVVFNPKQGGLLRGFVRQVRDRSAVVEMRQAVAPPVGTRGEVLVPRGRFGASAPKKPTKTDPAKPIQPQPGKGSDTPADKGKPAPKDPPKFRNQDKGYKPGMPLLHGDKPFRPEQRPTRWTGRLYSMGDYAYVKAEAPNDDFDSSIARMGIDAVVENPFEYGGILEFDLETNYRTETNDRTGADVLPRRASYTLGGTRFRRDRVQIGRFVQYGVPELQFLDGIEWGYRRENGDRFGASIGWMPEPNDDFESGKDSQVAVYYEWVVGDLEELTVTTALQKTLHNGKSDRDLLLTKVRYDNEDGWDLNGVLWIDFYNGRDTRNDPEVTQAWVSTTRTFDNGVGVDLTYRRNLFVETLRDEFLGPPLQAQLLGSRYDRLTLSSWCDEPDGDRTHGLLSIWQDQDDTGWNVEGGIEVPDLYGRQTTTDFTMFASTGGFSTDGGVRITHGKSLPNGRWDLLYQIALRHFRGIPDDRDDIIHHRLRYSRSMRLAGNWHTTLYAEGHAWDSELAWMVGFYLQRRF